MRDARRSYGSGSLQVRTDAGGRQTWYGKRRADGRRVQRARSACLQGTRDGLTRAQAEAELRRRIEREQPRPPRPDVTVTVAAERMLRHLEAVGRKPTTLGTYRSIFRTHLEPHPGNVSARSGRHPSRSRR